MEKSKTKADTAVQLITVNEIELQERIKHFDKSIAISENYVPIVSRYLSFLDRVQDSTKTGEELLPQCVFSYVENLIEAVNVNNKNFIFSKPISCGSFKEGVKIRHADEFDFTVILKSIDARYLDIEQSKLPQIKPKNENSLEPRVYYEVFFKDNTESKEMERKWLVWTKDCEHCKTAHGHKAGCGTCNRKQLSASAVQGEFYKMVSDVLHKDGASVFRSGPAVSFFLQVPNRRLDIKIDLTLAISTSWPNLSSETVLNSWVAGKIASCYLVPANDFWRISFSDYESERIKASSDEDKKCFRAIKYLRDQLITSRHQKTVLDTYPLKVCFMNQTHGEQAPKPESPSAANETVKSKKNPLLGDMALGVLYDLEKRGSKNQLADHFIQNSSVLNESDKSYLETRRILDHLKKVTKEYKINGRFHVLIMLLILVIFITMLCITSAFYVFAHSGHDDFIRNTTKSARGARCFHENMKFETYLFFMQGAVWVLFGMASIGMMYTVFQICSKSELYKFFNAGVFLIYTCVLIVTGVLIALQLIIVSEKQEIDELVLFGKNKLLVECELTKRAVALNQIVFIVSSVAVSLATLYLVGFTLLRRFRYRKYPDHAYDYIFCDDICGFHRFHFWGRKEATKKFKRQISNPY